MAAQKPGEIRVFWLLFFKKVTAFFALLAENLPNR
jgi:hypothetical protein